MNARASIAAGALLVACALASVAALIWLTDTSPQVPRASAPTKPMAKRMAEVEALESSLEFSFEKLDKILLGGSDDTQRLANTFYEDCAKALMAGTPENVPGCSPLVVDVNGLTLGPVVEPTIDCSTDIMCKQCSQSSPTSPLGFNETRCIMILKKLYSPYLGVYNNAPGIKASPTSPDIDKFDLGQEYGQDEWLTPHPPCAQTGGCEQYASPSDPSFRRDKAMNGATEQLARQHLDDLDEEELAMYHKLKAQLAARFHQKL